MIPIESLVLFLQTQQPDTTKGLSEQVKRWMKAQGARHSQDRKDLMLGALNDRSQRKKMGYIAVVYCLKENISIDFSE
jgi:hypothetical protein